MIRVLKISHGHPFYRANQSMNRKAIQEDETATKRGDFLAVRRPSTGRGNLADRSTQSREHCRPFDDSVDRSTPSREDRRPFDPPVDRPTSNDL